MRKWIQTLDVSCKMYADCIKVYWTIVTNLSCKQHCPIWRYGRRSGSYRYLVKNNQSFCWKLEIQLYVLPAHHSFELSQMSARIRLHLNGLSRIDNHAFLWSRKQPSESTMKRSEQAIQKFVLGLAKAVLIRAYKTYGRSIMEYGTTVFSLYKRKDIDLLESKTTSPVSLLWCVVQWFIHLFQNWRQNRVARTYLSKRIDRRDPIMMFKN